MLNRNRTQYKIATGRITLPVAILISLALWASYLPTWTEGVTIIACALTTYLMIEMNTALALIRTRTDFPPAVFLLFFTACPFLSTYSGIVWVPFLFIASAFALFSSYESQHASTTVFHAFLCIGIGSMLLPHLLLFIPLLYIQMSMFRSLSLRTFFAGVVGIILPYVILLCYHLYVTHTPEAVYIPLRKFTEFLPVDYTRLSLSQLLSAGSIILISIVSSVQSLAHSYQDKVQTRIYYQALAISEAGVILLIALQPQHLNALLPVLLIINGFMSAHLFALTFNRFTRIYFFAVTTIWLLLCLFNLWTHFFNF